MNLPPASSNRAGTAPSGGTIAPRHLESGAGASWWGEGWTIFRAAPLEWIGIAVIFAIVSIVLTFIPIVGGIAQTVLAPVFAGGVMLGCDGLARGQPLTVGHLFEGFRGPHLGSLLVLGIIWLGILAVTAIVLVAGTFIALGASGIAALMHAASGATFDVTSIDYGALRTAGMTVAVLSAIAVSVAVIAASAYWFAPALVVLNGQAPISALRASFAASWVNFGAFLLYSVIGVGLAIVASIPVLLGWLVLGPMTAGTVYAGWRGIFGPAS
ncbi:MAG: BPSS1780 family membrane protein [Casimicrobiaceae bacterium]